MMYSGNHMSTGGWIFSIFGTLIILALVIAAIVWIVSQAGNRGGNRETSAGSPGETLDRRLARGEITVDQYDEVRKKLAAEPPPDSGERPLSPSGVGS